MQWEGPAEEGTVPRSIPNATTVQQETDMNYGPFKSVIHSNLKNISTASFSAKKSMKLGPSTFGLIVYGGVCPISKVMCV